MADLGRKPTVLGSSTQEDPESAAVDAQSGLKVGNFSVHGMTCGACVSAVERALLNFPGVRAVQVTLMTERARIEFDSNIASEANICEEIESIGFEGTHLGTELLPVATGIGSNQTPGSSLGIFAVEGMMCGACVSAVERGVRGVPGVTAVSVSLLTKQAKINFMPADVQEKGIVDAIEDLGFEATHLETVHKLTNSAESQLDQCYLMIPASSQIAAEAALQALPGVHNVQWLKGGHAGGSKVAVQLLLDERAGIRTVIKTLKAAGCQAEVTSVQAAASLQNRRSSEIRSNWRSLLISAFFAIPCMLLAMVLPRISALKPALMMDVGRGIHLNAILLWALATPVQFFVGSRFYIAAYKGARHCSFGMDFLIAMGTSAAYFYSAFSIVYVMIMYSSHETANTSDGHMVHREIHDMAEESSAHGSIAHAGSHFFETSATLITFVLLGKFLESLAKARTSAALTKLTELTPQTAWLVEDGQEAQEIPAELVQRGDLIQIVPGGKVPSDGMIVQGESSINESMLTGEAVPVTKGLNDLVFGGTISLDGCLLIKITQVGTQTALSRIIKLVENAQLSKAPIQAYADRISGRFAPSVMLISAITFVVWICLTALGAIPKQWYPTDTTDFVLSMMFAIAVLVIACPCALGLATPTAVMVGTSLGARMGILIKGGDALETAHKVTDMIFDKTGTLTKGQPEVTDVIIMNSRPLRDLRRTTLLESVSLEEINTFATETLIFFSAAAEKGSEHPFARAIVAKAEQQWGNAFRDCEVSDFKSHPGKGVTCSVDGHSVQIGTNLLMNDQGVSLGQDPTEFRAAMNAMQSQGKTVIAVAIDKVLCGLIALKDTPKTDSAVAIALLESIGIRVWMLTGDNRSVANLVAKDLGIKEERVLSEQLPHQKAEQVVRLQQEGKIVGMTGDGINDAPALAQANLGVAIGAGTDVAIEAADVVLCNSKLTDVFNALHLSRTVFRRIGLNFLWALGFNTLGIPIAAGLFFPIFKAVLPPEVAGFAMALSSVSVVCSSLQLFYYRPPTADAQVKKLRGESFSQHCLNFVRRWESSAKRSSPYATPGCLDCPQQEVSGLQAEERLGMLAGCAMQWGAECSCRPEQCICRGCTSHPTEQNRLRLRAIRMASSMAL